MYLRISKIAGFIIVVLLLTYWGFSYLRGFNLFETPIKKYHSYFDNATGLTAGSLVTINGYQVGQINKLTLERANNTNRIRVKATFGVQTTLKFSKQSTVLLSGNGLMGVRNLEIIPSFEGETATNGDVLKSKISLGILDKVEQKIDPIQKKLLVNLEKMDTLVTNLNAILNTKTQQHFKNIIARLDKSLGDVNKITLKSKQLLDKNEEKIANTLGNVEHFSSKLSKIPLEGITQKMDTMLYNLNSITQKIIRSEGTLGKIVNDTLLYHNLNQTLIEGKSLMKEFKLHPKRFVHFSLFGKKPKPYKEEK